MPEYNILEEAGWPQTKKRSNMERATSPQIKAKAEELSFDFYDGNREYGYGGYYYDGRWKKIADVIKKRYNLTKDSKVLIDRCHKGFLVFDLKKLIPGITVYGLSPSKYTINHAVEGYGKWAVINKEEEGDAEYIEKKAREEIIPFLIFGYSNDMPFKDRFFDCVISIENACVYPEPECRRVIREIARVSKDNGKYCYVQNDSWRNEEQKRALMRWTFLCKTFLEIKEWEKLYEEEGYNGEWGYTIIE